MAPTHVPAYDRMVRRLKRSDESDCLEWQGATTHFGHGVIGIGGRGEGNILVHRLMWEHHFGPVPDGLCVLHDCDNPPCVYMPHLFLGDRADNNRDMWNKRRHHLFVDPDYLTKARWAKRATA